MNLTFIFLLAAAWAVDRWPHFGLALLTISFAVLAAELWVLYSFAKREQSRHNGDVAEPSTGDITQLGVASARPRAESDGSSWPLDIGEVAHIRRGVGDAGYRIANADLNMEWVRLSRGRVVVGRTSQLRPRASQVETWAFAALRDSDRARPQLRLDAAKRKALAEAKWEIVPQGANAFTVRAGAFEIEHFHGQTNIRVLDTGKVTVEAGTRGATSEVTPRGVSAPQWN